MRPLISSSRQMSVTVFVATLSLVALTGPGMSQAQMTDITSSGLNTQISTPTPLPDGMINYDITGGTRPGAGANLFHSFGEFSVGANNIANFLNETHMPTENILSRVTDGNPSNIFGTIQTTNFGAANLYLINPAGVMFGATAELNVGGSFAASTADYLKMSDGVMFSADAPLPTLSIAPVAAFGFIGPNPSGKITIDGGTGVPSLTVQSGQNFSLIGGDISVTGRTLSAPGGQINLASVASAGEVSMNTGGAQPPQLTLGGFTSLGNISLSQGASIDSSANTAGPIVIFGGQLVMNASSIKAIALSEPGGANSTTSIPTTIAITADKVVLSNGTQIMANTEGTAPAGDITFNVGTFEARPGSNSVPLNRFQMTGNLIASDSQSMAANAGDAGTITIQGINGPGSAAGTISLGSSTLSTRVFGGTADTSPASIFLTADSVAFSDSATALILPPSQNNPAAALVATSLGPAPAGNIALNVNTLRVNVNLDGTPIEGARRVFINNPSVNLDSTAGPAGALTISGLGPEPTDAARLVAFNNAQISSAVEGGTAALTPGVITITADAMTLTGKTFIFASSRGPAPSGNIAFHVNTLRANVNPDGALINGQPQSSISSTSSVSDSTAGRAGTLTVSGVGRESTDAATLVALNNTEFRTTVNGGTEATIPATITMTADTLRLTNSGNIKADTSGAAPGGNIALHVGKLLSESSTISSSSTGTTEAAGVAGALTVSGLGSESMDAATLVALNNTEFSTTVKGGTAAEALGTIAITADKVVLSNGTQIMANTEGTAPAGDITFNVGTFEARPGSNSVPLNRFQMTGNLIASDSQSMAANAGDAGTITIQGINGPGSAAGTISLGSSTLSTRVFGGTADTSPASIFLTADSVAFSDSATALILPPSQNNPAAALVATSLGPAPAGNIALNVNTLRVNVNLDGTPIEGARRVFINNPSVNLDSTAGPAGALTISGLGPEPTDAARLVAFNNAQISSAVEGGTAALTPGVITITADAMTLTGKTFIFASSRGPAPSGNIAFHVNTLRANVNPDGALINGQPQSSISSTSSVSDSTAGRAGTLTVSGVGRESTDAATLVALNNTEFRTTVNGGTEATIPATITMTADTLRLTNSGNIKADTSGAAPGGNITFNATNLTIDGASQMTSSTSGPGRGGDITITGSSATVGGTIAAETSGPGSGGEILVNVETLHLTSDAETSTRSNSTQSDAGDAGQIAMHATGTFQSDGGSVVTSAAQGKGGPITISAGNLTFTNEALVSAENTGSKDAGNIALRSATDLLMRNSTVTTRSNSTQSDAGDAGQIAMHATGTFQSDGGSVATSAAQGKGGPITISAGNLTFTNETLVSAENTGSKDAGNIALTSGSDLFMRNSTVTTSALQGSGGGIKLTAPNLIRLVDSTLTSSVQGQAGSNGGNITIDPQLVVIQNSQLRANANAGAGGIITIAATGAVLVDPNSLLSATAGPAGISGTVNINAPIQVLSGALVPLNLAYSQAALSGDRCAADPTGQFSSFVQTGRDGVPQVPGALAPSPLSFLENLITSSLGSPAPNWAAARLGLDSVSIDNSTLFQFHSACRS